MTVAALEPRRRRTWPQRLLLLCGVLVAAGCFLAAQFFWEARTILADLPRIRVGPEVLATGGDPGDPVNVLLVGVDSSEGLDPDDPVRDGRNVEDEARGVVRPDTILILRLDPATGNAAVLSLPRDLIVEAPGGGTTKINATQAVGGMEALISTIDSNLDIPINHFIIADFAGFAEIVEIVGGVPINFPYPTRDLGSALLLDAGCWSLNGSESLGYVRARNIEEMIDGEWIRLGAVSPDLARIERQQEFLVLALEQVLDVGRSDLSRIGDFIDAGTQAVQLDEELTPGDMLDLASAFADYDTEALAVSTLPVAAQFAEDGRYVGEALVTEQAGDLLAIFQGNADGVRPDQVSLEVASASDSHADQLEERGFMTIRLDREAAGQTTIQFDPANRDEALLVARYLEGVPKLAPGFGSELRLTVGADFAGVRQFPRPVGDIAPGLDQSIRLLTGATTTTVVPPVTSETSSTNVVNDDDPDLASTLVPDSADVPIGPATSDETSPTIVVRGRPPDGASCVPTGG
jgi:LCP family protein required for cell wall assembly